MAIEKKFTENFEFSKLPATGAGARALNLEYYFTGKPCKRNHLSIRYSSSGNCVDCIKEKLNRSFRSDRSDTNIKKALLAAKTGNTTFISENPCPKGHFLKYINSNNCVECDKLKTKERKDSQKTKWRRMYKLYGITKDEYNNLITNQENKCLICNKNFTEKNVHVDHCHTTGKIRGLLCSKCNQGIGLFNESIDLIKKAIIYLENNNDS